MIVLCYHLYPFFKIKQKPNITSVLNGTAGSKTNFNNSSSNSGSKKNLNSNSTMRMNDENEVPHKFIFPPPKNAIDRNKVRSVIEAKQNGNNNAFSFSDPEDDDFDSAYPVDLDEEEDDSIEFNQYKSSTKKAKKSSTSNSSFAIVVESQ